MTIIQIRSKSAYTHKIPIADSRDTDYLSTGVALAKLASVALLLHACHAYVELGFSSRKDSGSDGNAAMLEYPWW